MTETTTSTTAPHPAPSPIAAIFAEEPGVVTLVRPKKDSLSVACASSVCDVVGVLCMTYIVVACCSIVMIDVDSGFEAGVREFVVFWDGLNSAIVTAGKNGSDTLDGAVVTPSMPLAFDRSTSVCVLRIGWVVARPLSSGSTDVSVGTLS